MKRQKKFALRLICSVILLLLNKRYSLAQTLIGNSFSPNGKFAMANYSDVMKTVTIVRSVDGNWQKEVSVAGFSISAFTSGSKLLMCYNRTEIYLIHLGSAIIDTIKGVQSYSQPALASGHWLAYRSNDSAQKLILRDLHSGIEKTFSDVGEYKFDDTGNSLVWQSPIESTVATLHFYDLGTGKTNVIWKPDPSLPNEQLINYSMSPVGSAVTYTLQRISGKDTLNSIWYYRSDTNENVKLADDKANGLDQSVRISDGFPQFTPDGKKIVIHLNSQPLPPPDPKMLKYNIWNYQDPIVQSQQHEKRNYTAILSVDAPGKLTRVEHDNELLITEGMDSDYGVLCHWNESVLKFDRNGHFNSYSLEDYNWKKDLTCDLYLVSLSDGKRTLIKKGYRFISATLPNFKFSRDEKYFLYFDTDLRKYLSYDIYTKKAINIEGSMKFNWFAGNAEASQRLYNRSSTVESVDSSQSNQMIIIDHFGDVWRVNLTCKTPPVNLTRNYFREHPFFKETHFENELSSSTGTKAILGARDERDLNQKFFIVDLAKPSQPQVILNEKNYHYNHIYLSRDGDHYLCSQESYSKAAVSYLGDGNRKTALKPEKFTLKPYLRKATLRWKLSDGRSNYGVLTYPKDFVPRKKYPVIVSYYENAVGKNTFLAVPANNEITFNSYNTYDPRKYFYFSVGFRYKIGNVAQSVRASMVPGIKKLIKLPYINSQKIGITGGSFGGYETYVLVSQTHLFAAAIPNSGLTNVLNRYFSEPLDPDGYENMDAAEVGQIRIGVMPWQRPDLYLKNSPIFYADRVSTPLLMGIGRKDKRVDGEQGLEMFLALRRLGKPAWLISYDGAGHVLTRAMSDWNIRCMQFFDYYLRDQPAPEWMSQGIPAAMKGRASGLTLDPVHRPMREGLKMKHEVVAPQQQLLLDHPTHVDDEGKIVNGKIVNQ